MAGVGLFTIIILLFSTLRGILNPSPGDEFAYLFPVLSALVVVAVSSIVLIALTFAPLVKNKIPDFTVTGPRHTTLIQRLSKNMLVNFSQNGNFRRIEWCGNTTTSIKCGKLEFSEEMEKLE